MTPIGAEMDVAKILHTIPIFSGLNTGRLDKIMPLLERQQVDADQKIIKEGSLGDAMYIILKGSVRVTKTGYDHREVMISSMDAGSYFGELSLLDNLPRSANVTTNEQSELLRLGKENFEQLLEKNKDFAVHFYKNCMMETMARIRETASNLTLSQNVLNQKTSRLDMIDADLSNAQVIQDYFIRSTMMEDASPLIEGVKQTYIYKPFLEVGGDFINVARLDKDKLGIVIADVMGHGISAAMATGVMKSAFNLLVKEYGQHPVELMQKMNKHFYDIFTTLYATCYYALIDMEQRMISLTKAGHNHPIIWKYKQKQFVNIEAKGPGLGIIPDAKFEAYHIDIESGDKVLFFTDGIIEQRNALNEMYSLGRLNEVFQRLIMDQNTCIIQSIFEDLKAFSKGEQFQDDISLLLFEF